MPKKNNQNIKEDIINLEHISMESKSIGSSTHSSGFHISSKSSQNEKCPYVKINNTNADQKLNDEVESEKVSFNYEYTSNSYVKINDKQDQKTFSYEKKEVPINNNIYPDINPHKKNDNNKNDLINYDLDNNNNNNQQKTNNYEFQSKLSNNHKVNRNYHPTSKSEINNNLINKSQEEIFSQAGKITNFNV